MKSTGRVVLVLAAAVAGLVAVLSFHAGATSLTMPTADRRAPQRRQRPTAAPTSTSRSGSNVPLVLIPRSAAGASERYGYGVLSVTVSVLGTRLQDIRVTSLQTDSQYSQQLAAQVIPTLRSEVLAAQSARINGISGASYTSQAYALSVQSALDKLHVA
jgi:uncharacterized protein with FMN-binding domain